MKILHILRNNKFGGTQVLASTLSKDGELINHYFFLDISNSNNYLNDQNLNFSSESLSDLIKTGNYSLIISYVGFSILRSINPSITTPHFISCGSKLDFKLTYYAYSFYSIFFKNLKILATSKTVFSSIKKYRFKNISVVPNPVRDDFFEQKFEFRSEINSFAMVGRMDIGDKARNWSLFCELSEKYSNYKFYAIGDGNLRPELEAKFNKITFTGNLNVQKLLDQLKKSDIYLQLNNETEGFGISLYEAMSLGCIPIAPDIPVNNEIILNKYNGFLYSENKIHETINYLLKISKKNLKTLSIRAAKSIVPYTSDNYIQKIKKLYNEDFNN